MTLPMTYKRSMIHYFYDLGIILLVIIGFQILGLIFSIVGGDGLSHLTINDFFGPFITSFCGATFVLSGLYYLIYPYREFKFSIQNGQTRHQIWISQIMGIITLTIFSWLVWLISTLPYDRGLDALSIFGPLLLIIDDYFFAYAIGSGFALLPRMWKWIVGIGGPTIFMILLVRLAMLIANYWNPSRHTVQVIVNFFNWQGSWLLFGLLWLAIMAGLSFIFTMRIQLRRD